MRSHLLEGKVRHRRARPFVYALEHDVFYVALDLGAGRGGPGDPALGRNRPERARVPRRATTWTRRRPTSARPSSSPPARARASTRRAGGSRWSRTCGSSATCSTRPASSSAATATASCASSSSRSTTRTASGTCTRSAREATRPGLRRVDGQGLLRLAVHRDGRRATRSASRTSRRACGSRSTSTRTTPLLHASLADAPAPDRPDRSRGCCSATRSSPSKTIGHHPPARPGACGGGARGSIDTARRRDERSERRRGRCAEHRPLGGGDPRRGSPGGSALAARVADHGRLPDGRAAGRLADATSATATSELRAEIHIHDRAAARPHAPPRRDRRRRGVHGRPVVEPRPAGAPRAGGRSTARRWRCPTGWWRVPAQLRRTLAHRARRNTKSQARRNIAAHYDLGNDFYRLFLDETMTYSSAVFESPDQSLADAQRNKYRRIAEGAGLARGHARPRDRLRAGAASPCTRPASSAAG